MSEKKQVAKAAGVVGGVTLISRVLGYVRSAVIAYYFGAGSSADAFFAAFRIPNFLRRLFGEGSLTVSFVPVFTETLENEGKKSAQELVSAAFTAIAGILAIISVLGVIFAPQIILVLAPGFQETAAKFDLTVFLTRVMFPYAFLICLVALSMGVLNSLRHFFAPAFAPVMLNIAIIICAVGLTPFVDPPILAIAIGVLVGGVLQLALQIPFLRKKGYLPTISFNFGHPGLRRVALLMLPALFGLAVHSLAVFINTIFASVLAEGSLSYFVYADRLMELPLGVFGIAVGTAVLPSMSRQASKKDFEGLKDTLSFALRLVMFISLPATVGLIVLNVPVVNVLFQRGAFDLTATQATADALVYFCLGLPFFSAVRVIVPTFYSMKDMVTPVIYGAAALFTTLFCDLLFIGPIQYQKIKILATLTEKMNITGPLAHGGLALATSAGAVVYCVGLLIVLKRRIGKMGGTKIAVSFIRSTVASLVMGAAVWFVAAQFEFTSDGFSFAKFFGLVLSVGVGVLVYGGCAFLLGSNELNAALRIVKQRFARRK